VKPVGVEVAPVKMKVEYRMQLAEKRVIMRMIHVYLLHQQSRKKIHVCLLLPANVVHRLF